MSISISQRMNRDIQITFLVVAVLFVAIGAFMQWQWKNDNIQTVCRFLDMLVSRERSNMANELFERRYVALKMRLVDISSNADVLSVVLYDRTGKPVAMAADGQNREPLEDVPWFAPETWDGDEGYTFQHDFSALRFTSAVSAAGETLGWIRISHDLSLLRKQTFYFFAFFFLMLFITLVCMQVLLRRRLLHSVANPLRELGASMRAMDAESLTQAAPLQEADLEIAGLGEAFQELLGRLARTYSALDEANEALTRSERRLSRAIGASTDAIWEWHLDTGEAYFSPRWYEMLGFRDREFPMSFETWKRLCHPDDFEKTQGKIMRTVESQGSESYKAEFRMRTRDGGWKWILGRGDVIRRDALGRPLLLSGTHTDITERRLAEERLRQSEEKFYRLFHLSPDSIVLINVEDGRLVDVNDTFLLFSGYARDEVLGKTTLELGIYRNPEDREKLYAHLEREGSIRNFEFEARRKDGSTFIFSMASQMMNLDGKPHLLAVLRDITQLKQMQELMIQSEKMRSVGGMAAGIAHEINNPLGIIMQASHNLVQRTRPDFEKNRDAATALGLDMGLLEQYMRVRKLDVFIEDIQTAGARAAGIIRRMLDFSRMSESSRSSCDIARLVEQSLALARTDYDLKKSYDFNTIRIDVSMEEYLPSIRCTETEIEQVILNLLRNAAQAMAAADPPIGSPHIGIRVSSRPGGVRIVVEDNGPGMAPEVCRRVFEPFFTTKPPGLGTGLGLAVSYFIVTKGHGGTMRVESEPGKGTRFIIDLPSSGNDGTSAPSRQDA